MKFEHFNWQNKSHLALFCEQSSRDKEQLVLSIGLFLGIATGHGYKLEIDDKVLSVDVHSLS